MTDRCCSTMERQLDAWSCPQHDRRIDCPDALLAELPNGLVGLIVHDGGAAMVAIDFCPWCGAGVGPA